MGQAAGAAVKLLRGMPTSLTEGLSAVHPNPAAPTPGALPPRLSSGLLALAWLTPVLQALDK